MRAASPAPEVAPPPAAPRRKARWLPALSLVVGGVFLFPVAYLLWEAIFLGSEFWATLSSGDTLRPLANSLLIASTTAAACAVLGTSLAWLVARSTMPGRAMWRLLLPLPLVIPSFVGATAILVAFGPGGLVPFFPRLDGFWGAFVVLTMLSYPYVYLPVLARLRATPASLEEASRLLGVGTWRTQIGIVLPQLRSAIAAGTLLVFLYGLSDFGAVSLMRFDTITRAIFSSRLFDRTASLTLGLVLALLALGVAAVDRAVPRRPHHGAIGRTPARYSLGTGSILAVGLATATVGLALVAPIGVFVAWVVRGSSTVGVGYSGLGDDLGFLLSPLVNSAVAAVVAAAVAAIVVLPVAFATVRRRRVAAGFASTVVTSTFALPGLVVALAIVFWAVRAPAPMAFLYQSFPLLILAYVLHFGAQTLQASETAIGAVPARYDEAARMLGAGGGKRFLTVDLPLMAPGLLAGAGLVLLSTLKELPATLLLAPIGFDTLATRIWAAAEDGFFAEVGITSLVLILLSGALTWSFVLRPELER